MVRNNSTRTNSLKVRLIVISLLVLLVIPLLSSCTGLFFVPERQLILEPDRLNLDFTEIIVPTDDQQKLHGWLLTGQQPVKGTVIFLHGNAQNISYHIASVQWLPKHGYNVFLYDYQGYGKSSGKASVENSIANFASVIHALSGALPDAEQKYSVFGQSLGGALAIAAVAKNQSQTKFHTLIVDSAFSGFRTIAKEKMSELLITKPFAGALQYLFTTQPDILEEIASIHAVPILILHGLNDKIVPPAHAQKLFAQANEPKQLHLQANANHIQSLASPVVMDLMLEYLGNSSKIH